MIRDLGRVGGGRAGRHAERWVGGIVACLLLAIAGPATARQAAATTSSTQTPAIQSYDECTRAYASRRDVASYCRRLFPAPAAVTSYDTCVQATGRTAEARRLCAQRYPDTAPKPAEPVDITPQLNKLIDSWVNQPKPPAKPPADPLAVIPGIQAACAPWADDAQRWLRCAAEGWRETGLRGQPPLALQTPPTPPVIDKPSVPQAPVDQVPVKPPPVRPDPPPIAKPPAPEPPVVAQSDPPVDVAPPAVKPEPPPTPVPSPPKLVDPALPPRPAPPSVPLWAWLLAAVVALVAAGAGGFGLSRWLSKAKPASPRQAKVEAAPSAPTAIALVADLGVVTLTPDGPPRAGMAVSMRVALDTGAGADAVRLDYPSLETAP